MRTIIFLLLLLSLVGCESGTDGHVKEFSIGKGIDASWLRTYHIEGCEYIGRVNGNGALLTHKGNCSNPVHNCPCDTMNP